MEQSILHVAFSRAPDPQRFLAEFQTRLGVRVDAEVEVIDAAEGTSVVWFRGPVPVVGGFETIEFSRDEVVVFQKPGLEGMFLAGQAVLSLQGLGGRFDGEASPEWALTWAAWRRRHGLTRFGARVR